jgi:outer membrane protein assembly factor BamB
VTWRADGTVARIDAASGRELARLAPARRWRRAWAAMANVSAVVTASNDLVVLEAGRELWRQKLPAQATPRRWWRGRVFVLAPTARHGLRRPDRRAACGPAAPGEPLVLRQAGVLLAVGDTAGGGPGGAPGGHEPGQRQRALGGADRHAARHQRRGAPGRPGGRRQPPRATWSARGPSRRRGLRRCRRGAVLWTKPGQRRHRRAGDDASVFGTESDGRVLAWRADTGERAWANDRLQWRGLTGPLVLGRSVVVGDSRGSCISCRARTARRWTAEHRRHRHRRLGPGGGHARRHGFVPGAGWLTRCWW